MYQYVKQTLSAFSNGVRYTTNTTSVIVNATGVELYSYNLLVGKKDLQGKVYLIPYPGSGTPKEKGGTKTTRALMRAAWDQWQNASFMK